MEGESEQVQLSLPADLATCVASTRTRCMYGPRAGGFGSFLLAIYDAETEEFQSISKIGTGFSEELLKELSDQLKDLVIPRAPRYYRYVCNEECNAWGAHSAQFSDMVVTCAHPKASHSSTRDAGHGAFKPLLLACVTCHTV
jgi:hypothetical protein